MRFTDGTAVHEAHEPNWKHKVLVCRFLEVPMRRCQELQVQAQAMSGKKKKILHSPAGFTFTFLQYIIFNEDCIFGYFEIFLAYYVQNIF